MPNKVFNSPEEAAFAMRAATGVQKSDEVKLPIILVNPYDQTMVLVADENDQDKLP